MRSKHKSSNEKSLLLFCFAYPLTRRPVEQPSLVGRCGNLSPEFEAQYSSLSSSSIAMARGYLYILKNKSHQDYVVKIGKTTRHPDLRAKEMYSGSTGVPEPFDVAFFCSVAECSEAELQVHKQLASYRVNDSREFFRVPPAVGRQVVIDVCNEVNAAHGEGAPAVVSNWPAKDCTDNDARDRYEEKFGLVHALPIDLIEQSPVGTSKLTPLQARRVNILRAIFLAVDPDTEESWHDDFTRDRNPEPELRIWEHIAKAFLKIDEIRLLSSSAKREAYSLLLARSSAPTSAVLKKHRLTNFSEQAARDIMAGYELPPVPLAVVWRPHKGKKARKIVKPVLLAAAIQRIYRPGSDSDV